MERMKASDFDQRILDLFDGYVHGALTKREFLERAAVFAGTAVAASAAFEALKPNYALAAQVPPEPARVSRKA
jgi:carboxymethylenebutenolidase